MDRFCLGVLGEMGHNLLLTGKPGVGKTTVIRKTLGMLKDVPAGGFFTEEVRKGGRRIGFRVLTLDGQEAWLAREGFLSSHRVGKYGVNDEAIGRVIIPALQRALETSRLIVVDEIAKMELCHPSFGEAVWACLESPKPVLGVIQQSRLPFLEKVRARFDVQIWEVTVQNRDRLPGEVVKILKGWLGV